MIYWTNVNLLELNYKILTTGDSEVKGNCDELGAST